MSNYDPGLKLRQPWLPEGRAGTLPPTPHQPNDSSSLLEYSPVQEAEHITRQAAKETGPPAARSHETDTGLLPAILADRAKTSKQDIGGHFLSVYQSETSAYQGLSAAYEWIAPAARTPDDHGSILMGSLTFSFGYETGEQASSPIAYSLYELADGSLHAQVDGALDTDGSASIGLSEFSAAMTFADSTAGYEGGQAGYGAGPGAGEMGSPGASGGVAGGVAGGASPE